MRVAVDHNADKSTVKIPVAPLNADNNGLTFSRLLRRAMLLLLILEYLMSWVSATYTCFHFGQVSNHNAISGIKASQADSHRVA